MARELPDRWGKSRRKAPDMRGKVIPRRIDWGRMERVAALHLKRVTAVREPRLGRIVP
jgi:hypothetical protein